MTRRRVVTPSRVDAEVSPADGAGVDAFGRVRTSEPTNRFDVEFTHDLQPLLVDAITAGGGTVTFDSTHRDASLKVNGVGATAAATLGGHYHVPYTPGNSQLIDMTGTLDTSDIGGTVAVVLKKGGNETVTEEAAWKRGDLVSDVDWAKSQILTIDFQSLKVGRLRLGLVRKGVPQYFHWIENDNLSAHGYWQYPSLSPFWKIYNTASHTIMEMGYGDGTNGIFLRFTAALSASAEMTAICATVKSEGGEAIFDLPGFRAAASNGSSHKTVSTTLIPILSARVKTTLGGVPNVGIYFEDNIEFSTDNAIYWELRLNATLTGAAFASLGATIGLEQDTTASAVSGGRVLAAGYAGAGGTRVAADRVGAQGRVPLSCGFSGAAGDVLTLCAIRAAGQNSSVGAAMLFREVR